MINVRTTFLIPNVNLLEYFTENSSHTLSVRIEMFPPIRCVTARGVFLVVRKPATQLCFITRFVSSGHASISVYAALFLIWFLQCRIPQLRSLFLIPLIQSMLMIWTSFCCISRITDHRHHPHDVIGGVFLGFVFAFYTCHILSDNFCDDKHRSSNSNRRIVRRLLSTVSPKEEVSLNNLE